MEQQESFLEDITAEEVEASYGQRIVINITDGLIAVLLIVGFYFLLPGELVEQLFGLTFFMKYFIAFLIIFGSRLIFILSMGKTIGMKIARVKYLNARLLPLTTKEKLIAVFATRTPEIRYYKV